MKAPSLKQMRGNVDKAADMLPGVSPPALVEYLLAADRYVLDVLSHPYAAPAMCVDATSNGASDARSGGAIFAPGTTHGRLWITRSGAGTTGGATQAATEWSNTSSGAAAADAIEVYTVPTGAAGYLDVTAAGLRYVWTSQSGDKIDNSPSSAGPRQAEIAVQLSPAVEDFVAHFCDGVTFYPSIQSVDLEAL